VRVRIIVFVLSVLIATHVEANRVPKTSEAQPAGQMLVRTHSHDLSLIADGTVRCAIVCPQGRDWHKLAERIAERLRRLGASYVPIVTDTEVKDLQEHTLILLGDLNTNRAIFPLYANYYTYCDARYPGGSGYVLRTIVRPFGRQVNYLLVGGSTLQGVAAGVQKLLAKLDMLRPGPNVTLPHCLEIELGPELADIFAPFHTTIAKEHDFRLPEGKGNYGQALKEFKRNAHLYFYTGKKVFAQRARRWALFLADYDPKVKFIHTNDYSMEELAAVWRRVSVSPAFTKADRQKLDQVMYATAAYQEKQWWRQKDASKGIGMRHHTTGMLAWWTLIRTLIEIGQPDDTALNELIQWRREAEAYLDGLLCHYWDDADDYQSADSVQNTASYALQSNQLEWFDNRLAACAAKRLLATVDNLGWYSGIQGYGEALPGWERFTLNGGLLLGSCGFIYNDGSYKWILDHFPDLQKSWGSLQPWGLHQYDTGDRLQPHEPDWLKGLQVIPFTSYRMGLINSGDFLTTDIMDGFKQTGLNARPVSPELAFDKLVLRNRPDTSGLYLLLQGSSAITLSTIDMNSIIRLTDQSKLWLVHNTARRSLYFKNAVYVSNGTNERPIPASCELVGFADFGEVALAASRLPDNRGTNWTRNIIATKDRFTVVIDQVRAIEPGQYTAVCTWRTPGFAELTETDWRSQQQDVTFHLLPGEMKSVSSKRLLQNDGATRPTILRQNRLLSAGVGDDLIYENLLYTSGPARQQNYTIRRIAPGMIVIRSKDNTFYLAAANDSGITIEGLTTDAAAILLGPQGVYMVGGTELTLDGERFDSVAGRIPASPVLSQKMTTLLEKWWSTSQPVCTQETKTKTISTSNGPDPSWTHIGPCSVGGLIDGVRMTNVKNVTGDTLLATDRILPVLRAEPRVSPYQGSTLNPESQKTAKTKTDDPTLAPLKGAEFLLEWSEPTRVDEIALFGDTFGETSDRPSAVTLDIELTFSSDGFRTDKCTRKVSINREATFHNLYKGHAYLFECYRAKGLDEPASKAVNVRVLAGPSSEMLLTDVQVRTTGTPERQPVQVRTIDLDGDQRDEILVWTAGGELIVLDADGAERWRRHWPQGIIAVDAWDLENDGLREVFVSRTDRYVLVLNADGSIRWEKDFRNISQETDERLYGDGSVVYGLAAWQPADTDSKQVMLTSYWYTALFDTAGNIKKAFRRSGHFTQIRSVPKGLPGAGDLAIRSDIPWVGPVPIQWWHNTRDATLEPTEEESIPATSVPNGPAVFFELADYDGNGQAEALVATEQGIGLYARNKPKTRWQHMTDAPPVGVGVITEPGNKPATIIYGREDGYVFVLNAEGALLRSIILDEPITCLTAIRTHAGEPVILVGTESSLRCLRLNNLSTVWQRPGTYQRLDTLRIGGRQRILAVTQSGQLHAFDL